MTEQPIRVAVTDDHSLVIKGIETLLKDCWHIDLYASYEDGKSLLDALETMQPDVLLLDIQMPGIPGDELAAIIRKCYPEVGIIALTGFDTPFYIRKMMQQGCLGYLLKNTHQKTLIEAIECVHRGEEYVEAVLKERLFLNLVRIRKDKPLDVPDLTRRELDVLKLIVQEHSNVQIAALLFLSLRTVEKYRLHLMHKLKVKNTAGLVKAALELNLIA